MPTDSIVPFPLARTRSDPASHFDFDALRRAVEAGRADPKLMAMMAAVLEAHAAFLDAIATRMDAGDSTQF